MTTDRVPPRPIRNPMVKRENVRFSHPSEEEFARVLDFYGIEWRYETTTFPLQWNEKGIVMEAFSPDFYLVDADLYVELTTLRPSLMRFKKRKIRRIKELYPEVHIKLWTRNDFMRFLEHFGRAEHSGSLVGKEAVEEQNAAS